MNRAEPTRSETPDLPLEMDLIAAAKQRRACADLDRVRTARLVFRALDRGHAPAQITAGLGIAADTVSRTAREIRVGHDLEEVRPAEIINMYVAGEISGRAMLSRLVDKTYTAGQYDPTGGDGYRRGDWDEIQSAAGRRLINERQYEWLLANCEFVGDEPDRSHRSPSHHENILQFGLFGVDLIGFTQAADVELDRAVNAGIDAVRTNPTE